jgi:hypothetical protein
VPPVQVVDPFAAIDVDHGDAGWQGQLRRAGVWVVSRMSMTRRIACSPTGVDHLLDRPARTGSGPTSLRLRSAATSWCTPDELGLADVRWLRA